MFKSFINPEKIIGNGTKAVSPEAFSNFMSGKESSLSKSVLNSATNNISNFSIKGVSVDTSSNIAQLIQNISTSIVNNVDNSISNTLNSFKTEIQTVLSGVQQQVQSNLAAVIQNFSKDYQQRIQSKEDNKPSNVLKGFLGLYQNAIDFVSFFGDSKNNKKIEISLKSLRSMFDESFNTAIVIRQVINKIVKQLSNLPTATGNAGPLNLDVSVPGGRLKQAGGASIGKFLKGRGGQLLGAGVVGAGALGMMSMQAARASQEEKLAETAKRGVGGEDKPNEFMKGLDNIIERFSDAIDGLLGGKKKGSSGGGGGSASSGGGGGATDGGGGLSEMTGDTTVDSIGLKSNFSPIVQDIAKSGLADTSKLSDRAAIAAMIGVGQMETNFSYDKAYTGRGGTGNNMQGFIQLNRAVHPSKAFQSKEGFLNYTFPKFQGKAATFTGASPFKPLVFAKYLQNAKTGWDVANALKAAGFTVNDFDPLDTAEEANRLRNDQVEVLKKMVFNGMPVQPAVDVASKKPAPKPTPQTAQKPPIIAPAPRPISRVEPAPNPKAREVSQAITSPGQNAKNNVEVASLPPNITVIPGGESQNRGGVVPLSLPSGDAPDVSHLGGTGNPNNPNPYTSLILGMNFA